MRTRWILPLLAAALLALTAAAPASANYRVGIGDQDASMFDQPAFQALGVKRVRYLVPWDWYRDAGQDAEVEGFMDRARAARAEVLVTFTARRGCFEDGRYSRARACRAPSTTAYRRAFLRFRREFAYQRLFAAWNEGNHVSQPTYRSPRRAAQYYNTLRRACRTCRVMAADVLDSSNARTWLRAFLRSANGTPKLWGLHNYADVNRRRSRGTVAVLDTVPGEVWLTETGGIVVFGRDFPYSESRAANRTRYMFSLADRYDTRRPGLRSRLTRLYVYQYTGSERGVRFDAGLTNADGSPRAAYEVFRSFARRRLR